MTLSAPSQSPTALLIAAAHRIAPMIVAGETISRSALNLAMMEAFGTSSADGAWSQRDSFQMLEVATIFALREMNCAADGAAATEFLAELETRFPTQTVRSEEQIALQHFSTPLVLSWIIGHLAAVHKHDTVLEPSAGTGMLAQWLGAAKALYLNEIDPQRAAMLETLFPHSTVTSFDAARIASRVTSRPSVIVMNPPFARTASGHADGDAAARHLLSALTALHPGGRLVAVMPDSFSHLGRNRETFVRVLKGHHVRLHQRLEGAFTKHGTSIPIRVLVVDKVPGTFETTVINRKGLCDLLPHITQAPSRCALVELDNARSVAPSPAKTAGLFKAFGSRQVATRPVTRSVLEAMEAMDLPYTLREDIAGIGQDVGIYTDFRPQRLIFPTGSAHPSPLVESAAMASVALPAPSIIPKLPRKVIEQGLLSTAQLETLVHALDATAQDLPGRYIVPEKGVELQPHAEGKIYRRGFFLGDGTGAGKGRQLAAVLMDQWLRGNRRHIWISDSSALIEDARRDWQALGGMALDIQPLAKIKPERPIGAGDAILFASYATLRSASGAKTRLQQILDWCGDEFEGLILFDEAHAMGGVAGGEGRFGATKGSQQGITGVELQNRLPRARVIYASATGASDINNLAYAVRLGLWGEGTAFPDRTAFIARIREGGIAAMELVARELKAMGVYTARALSYAGVEYDILEHQLSVEQIADFDAYADAWSVVHQNMEEALSAAGVIDQVDGRTLNGQALSAARSRFESSKQRFFGQLLLSMKLPTLLPAMAAALEAEQSVVVQLVSTSEALLDRRLAELDAEDRAELSVDLSPKELLLDYLNSAFPTRAMESYWDDDGNERSRPMSDANGHPVHSQEALRIKADLIELLGALPPIVPALDAIIARFGADAVAEVTGRTRRLLSLPDGSQKLESRSPTHAMADANAFMAGKKRVLVFSDAGGTGRSYHASLDCQNQQRRVHFLLEPGWRADRAIQGLGRTNRTHQASAPIFRPVTTDCRGERRFISTIARRLDGLGALTRGQRQTGGQNLFDPADNLESDYARDALLSWYRLLHAGKLASVSFTEFCQRTGLRLEDREEGGLNQNLPPIQRWLNRILALPIHLQNAIFDEFLGLVEARIDAARKAGTFDAGVETIRADRLTVVEERVLREDPGSPTQLVTIEAQWAAEITSLADIRESMGRAGGRARTMRNGRSGRVALLVPDRTWLDDEGNALPTFRLYRPNGRATITEAELAESHWDDFSLDAFEALWEQEATEAATLPHIERLFLATGRLLPIWNLLGDEAQVRRLVTQDGRSLLGRIVPTDSVNALLTKLGLDDRIAMAPGELVSAAMSGKIVPIDMARGLNLKRSRVNGEPRLEITGFEPRSLPHWKAKGCFTEIIQYQTRLFVPVSRAVEIVEAVAA